MKLHLARNTKLLIAEDQVLAKSHMHYAHEQLGFKNMNYVDRPSHTLSPHCKNMIMTPLSALIICALNKAVIFYLSN